MLQKSLGSSTDPSWAGGCPESWLGEFQDTQMFALQNLLKVTSIDIRYTMDTLQMLYLSSTDPSWAGGRLESWPGEFQDTQMFALQNLLKVTSKDTRYIMDTLQMLYLSSTDTSWAGGRLESWPREFQDSQLLTLQTLLKITWWTIYRNVVEDFPEIHLDQEDPSILDQFLEGKRHFFGDFWDHKSLNAIKIH